MSTNLLAKLACWLLGHRSVCLHHHEWGEGAYDRSTFTVWRCERCGHEWNTQYDDCRR